MFELTRSTLTIFGFTIHWYGVLIALGVLGAVLLAWRREEKLGLKSVWARSLPGRLVPRTAAAVIRDAVYYILEEQGEPV